MKKVSLVVLTFGAMMALAACGNTNQLNGTYQRTGGYTDIVTFDKDKMLMNGGDPDKSQNRDPAWTANYKIDKDKIYTVATIDYLAEGNDGLGSFLKAEKRVCPEGAVLRHIVLDYVKKKTVKSEVITSRLDGRIQIKK